MDIAGRWSTSTGVLFFIGSPEKGYTYWELNTLGSVVGDGAARLVGTRVDIRGNNLLAGPVAGVFATGDESSPSLFEFHNYEDGHDECRKSWDMGRACAEAEGRLVYPAVDWVVKWSNSTGRDLFSLRIEVQAIRPRPGQYTSLGKEDDIVFENVTYYDLKRDFTIQISISSSSAHVWAEFDKIFYATPRPEDG